MTLVRRGDDDVERIFDIPEGRKNNVLQALVGPRLGAGVHREVYEIRGRPDVVLKVEVTARTFANIAEWQVWQAVQYAAGVSKWFAPCVHIDQDGGALIQRRTKPMPDRTWKTLEVPRFFTDMKQENWGVLDGRPVCHDYALHLMLERGMSVKSLKSAVPKWART